MSKKLTREEIEKKVNETDRFAAAKASREWAEEKPFVVIEEETYIFSGRLQARHTV